MYQHGRLDVLNIQPGHPTNLNCPYRISKRSGDMKIKNGKMYGQSQGGSWKQKEVKRKNWRQDDLHSP